MKLVIVDGPLKGREVPLDESPVTLGRKTTADVSIPVDGLISRLHCRVERAGAGWQVVDLDSGNGTFVGGRSIEGSTPLPPGRLVRLGSTHFVLVDDEGDSEVRVSAFPQATEEAPADEPSAFGPASWQGVSLRELPTQVLVSEDPMGSVAGERDPVAAPQLPDGADAETVRRLHAHLKTVRSVARAFAGKPEPLEMLNAVVHELLEVVPAQRAFVLEVGEDGAPKQALAALTRSGSVPEEVAISRTILRKCVRERMAVLVADAQTDARLAGVDSIRASALRSAIAVPLLDGGRVAALIYLDTRAAITLTEDDLELVTAVGNQATLALANGRLYQQLRQAYEDLERAHETMVQSEKLSIIGTLAASIAHDIGNVLTPISGVAKIMMRKQDIDPQLKAAFGRQMQRLKALTQQLLSFSRPGLPDLAPIDLNAQVEDSVSLVRTELRHDEVEILTRLDERLPPVLAEPNRLDQVLVNLCINAGHAMGEEGGRLVLRTFAEGAFVCIEVTDTGCGIPEERLAAIFEPFFTTKGKQGTGLGLFSCKRIVEEEHGGALTVRSVVGQGTTFRIALPGQATSS